MKTATFVAINFIFLEMTLILMALAEDMDENDEIDAICKARGSVAGNTGVNDTVVNQLLSKIDGVDQG